jgi:hypothetical protein
MPAATSAFTSAGTTIAFDYNGVPPSYNQAGYENVAVTYTAIGEVVDAGEFGRVYELVTHNPIGDRRTVKRKGSWNDGQVTLQLARVISNAGQAELKLGLGSDTPGPVRFTLQDGTKLYTMAIVMSQTVNMGGVNQILGSTVVLEITHDIIEVAPA